MGKESSIKIRLAELRQERGLPAASLARQAGISRQTIYSIEAGNFVPNTVVALRLARALQTSVEELFQLKVDSTAPPRVERARMLPGAEPPEPGQPVQLCAVGPVTVASAPSPIPWFIPQSDGIVTEVVPRGKTKVRLHRPDRKFDGRVLVAGCDPGISVLARHVQSAGSELILAHRNSSRALELLKQGLIHVAGTHLRDPVSGDSNIPMIHDLFPKNSVAVITYAVWEQGIVTVSSNPKHIRSIGDFARRDVTIVNRESGAGTRVLLDSELKRAGIPHRNVRGYDRFAEGHMQAAWNVHSGTADACIATEAAALAFGLGFIPLVAERYDLVVRKQHLELPAVDTLFATLARAGFRQELESLGGYDTRLAGRRVL